MSSGTTYDVNLCNQFKEKFREQKLFRPMRTGHYDAGTRLTYEVTGIATPVRSRVTVEIEKFVGGGFAGQVYKIHVCDIEPIGDDNVNNVTPVKFPLEKDRSYAMKILIPPSGFSKLFRNVIYRIGFQGPFQLQVNPAAARAGAIWQKFIRRGAKIRFGDEQAVNDIHATFIDSTLGSCGEISDWVNGRTWALEVDDRLDALTRFIRKKKVNPQLLGSPEYRAKRTFMEDFVTLLHDMGAHEFARQYEWSTCKSQPNCLKRLETETDPTSGLIAVDFRAGLALLPFLPMSPGDVKLIVKGMARGSLVQFDRGNLNRLEAFINAHHSEFADLLPMLDELKTCERIYRDSIPDITHNGFRLLYSKKLWSTILSSARTGWRIKNKIDDPTEEKLKKSTAKTLLFGFLGAIPILGGFLRNLWGRPDLRQHYKHTLTSWNYLRRSGKARCAEKAYKWYREGRVTAAKAQKIACSVPRFMMHFLLSLLPLGLHRALTDGSYLKERLHNLFVKPFQLYFSAPMREQWLRDMVHQGKAKRILNDQDAAIIDKQLKEPYIQKYLKSLAVHILLMPTTHIVSIIVSWWYVKTHPGLSYAQATAAVAAILVFFQITPVSPGSLARGLYVVYLMIKERNFRDYNIALFLSFFKYIGYLAFPIQMTYRYPELARFMAGHWATEIVHSVPVFGERGALLEHWVYRLFYNWPLTIRRRMKVWARIRENQNARYWHIGLYAIGVAGLLSAFDGFYLRISGGIPGLNENWWMAILLILVGSVGMTRGAGGAAFSRRMASAALWGVGTGILYPIVSTLLLQHGIGVMKDFLLREAWYIFIFAVFATIGSAVTELRIPDPELKAVEKATLN
ncbi:MAG: hypothetical protein ACM3SY_17080 [Candidatus Omnitrophota bacterium]